MWCLTSLFILGQKNLSCNNTDVLSIPNVSCHHEKLLRLVLYVLWVTLIVSHFNHGFSTLFFCTGSCLRLISFIKQHVSDIHVAAVCLGGHRLSLAGLMVLKGIDFFIFLLFFHQRVLKWCSIVTNGLQIWSIAPLGFAIGHLDDVGAFTIQDLSHCTGLPLQRSCFLLIWEEFYLLLDLENT